jgi:tetratricopeptide (TPR) repeat protein
VLLANLLQDAGRHALQIQVLQQGIAGCEATADFRNDYAYLLATSSDPKLRDGRAALSIARAVVEESGRKRPDYIDTLACAYAAVGDFSRALRLADEALGMLARRKMPPEVLALHRAHREQFARGEAVGAGG